MNRPTPTMFLILDGWGLAPDGPGNGFALADTPTLDTLLRQPSRSTLLCSGRAVGLPEGFMGNSEVGHLNIGAGRIVYQDITKIDIAIENNQLATNPVIASTIAAAKQANSTLHLIGLLSDGGVHSHILHLFALIAAAKAQQVRVAIHVIADGRDTGPKECIGFMQALMAQCDDTVQIASLSGRYYAMDRDKHWERVQQYWDMLVLGKGPCFTSPLDAIENAYSRGETDEFIKPCLIAPNAQEALTLHDNDALFLFNFRADRMRQLGHCLATHDFIGFPRPVMPRLAAIGTMTAYDATLPLPAAFVRENISNTLGEVLSRHGLRQLRIAETEKYAHVTYFFNGGNETPFPGEERILVPSPRDVATYDQKPHMSAAEVTDRLLTAWNNGNHDVYICNFANMDMVGHTGNLPAVIEACSFVDSCVERLLKAVQKKNGRLIITADHGNAEEMLTPEGTPQTAHSTNPVALLLVEPGTAPTLKPKGKLGDIAPTVLHLLGIPQPEAMTGESLVEE